MHTFKRLKKKFPTIIKYKGENPLRRKETEIQT